MEKHNKNFDEVLNKAKEKGYAESNPKSDLNGSDSESKIRILSSIAFNKNISKNKILTEGIQNINLDDILYAKTLGYKIKLLSISEIKNNSLIERVHPCLVDNNSLIAGVNGVLNAVIIDGEPVGRSVIQGEGAGAGPTSSSLISDLCSILRGNIKYPFGVSYKFRRKIKNFNIHNLSCSSYFRIEVKDIPGVLAEITSNLNKQGISVETIFQIPENNIDSIPIIIVTHAISKNLLLNAVSKIEELDFVSEKITIITIDKSLE